MHTRPLLLPPHPINLQIKLLPRRQLIPPIIRLHHLNILLYYLLLHSRRPITQVRRGPRISLFHFRHAMHFLINLRWVYPPPDPQLPLHNLHLISTLTSLHFPHIHLRHSFSWHVTIF